MNLIDKWIDRMAWLGVGVISSSMWWYWHDRTQIIIDSAYIHERHIPDRCATDDILKAMPGNRGYGRTIICEKVKK